MFVYIVSPQANPDKTLWGFGSIYLGVLHLQAIKHLIINT